MVDVMPTGYFFNFQLEVLRHQHHPEANERHFAPFLPDVRCAKSARLLGTRLAKHRSLDEDDSRWVTRLVSSKVVQYEGEGGTLID